MKRSILIAVMVLAVTSTSAALVDKSNASVGSVAGDAFDRYLNAELPNTPTMRRPH